MLKFFLCMCCASEINGEQCGVVGVNLTSRSPLRQLPLIVDEVSYGSVVGILGLD